MIDHSAIIELTKDQYTTDLINKAKKMTNCKLFTLKAIIESDKAIEILT